MPRPGQQLDLSSLILVGLSLSCGILVLALVVIFLFPLIQGGILGRLRDRLEVPDQPPRPLGVYGRTFYARLLGSTGLLVLTVIVLMLPTMGIGFGLALRELAQSIPAVTKEGRQPPLQQLTRQMQFHPGVLVAMGVAMFLTSAVSIVYWMANCIVVAEQDRVTLAWRNSLRFCRRNFPAVLVIWLLSLTVGSIISPLSLVGTLGIVKEMWVLVVLALLYSAVSAYVSVLYAGVGMSLYLARRPLLVEFADNPT